MAQALIAAGAGNRKPGVFVEHIAFHIVQAADCAGIQINRYIFARLRQGHMHTQESEDQNGLSGCLDNATKCHTA